MTLVHTHTPQEGRGTFCPERRDAHGLVGACQPARYFAADTAPADPIEPIEDVIEPITLPDLRALIEETAETLETLREHTDAIRRAQPELADPDAARRVVELHIIGDYLLMAWAKVRSAQTAAADLEALHP